VTPEDIRARILALQTDRKPQPLDVPEWGDDVYIRVLTANDQTALAATVEKDEMPVRIILHCLVDATGQRIFSDDDAQVLGEFPFPEIMTVFAKVAKLNGLSSEELEEAVSRFAPAPDEQRSIG
jgi:hypothetical protein